MSDRPGRPSLAERAERFGRVAETTLLTLVLAAMILLAAGQIILRNSVGFALAWADEALRIMVLWVSLLGAVAASREQRHVSIDALSRYLPHHLHHHLDRLTNGFVAGVCLFLAWYSWVFVADSWSADDRVLGGTVPAWAVQVVLPLAFGLLAYRHVVSVFTAPGRRVRAATDH